MCTSLTYRDAGGAVYFGRTMELDVELPYVLGLVPKGQSFRSGAAGGQSVSYTAKQRFLAVGVPETMPARGQPLDPASLKVAEGVNEAGLTFSLLAYPSPGRGVAAENTRAALQATDLGTWVLSQFTTAAEVKESLRTQPVFRTTLEVAGGVPFPFHMAVHDRDGASIVIELCDGEQTVYDNPVGVLTNGPEFPWHLTNLRNWAHLTNVDRSAATFGDLSVVQPDSGIATAALPASNTSVGRFVRAVYHANFAERVSDPDEALLTLARIMNNFDRPRGITIDPPGGGEGIKFHGTGEPDEGQPSSEYTSFTVLSDLRRGRFMVRTYDAFNYSMVDLHRITGAQVRLLPFTDLDPLGGDATEALQRAPNI